MSIAVVQTSSEMVVSSGSSGTMSLNGTVAGNMLVAQLTQETDATTFATMTETVGSDTFIKDKEQADSGRGSACIQSAANIHGGNITAQVTMTGGVSKTYRGRLHEVSGCVTTGVDVTDGMVVESDGGTGNHVSSSVSGITPTGPCIVFTSSCFNSASGARTPGSGYTDVSSAGGFTHWEYQIFLSAPTAEKGAYSVANTGRTTNCVIVAYKASAGGTTYNDSITLASKAALSVSMTESFANTVGLASAGNVTASGAYTLPLSNALASQASFQNLITETIATQMNLAMGAGFQALAGTPAYAVSVTLGIQATMANVMTQIMAGLVNLGASASEQQAFSLILNTAVNLQVTAALQALAALPGTSTPFIQLVLEAWSRSTLINEKGNV